MLVSLLSWSSAAAGPGPADQTFEALQTRRMERPPSGNVATQSAFQRQLHDEVSRRAARFLQDFPDDPRRWEVTAWAVNSPRLGNGNDGPVSPDWNLRRDELRDELLAGADVPDDIWVGVAERYIGELAGHHGTPGSDLAKAGRLVGQLAIRVPESSRRGFVEKNYLDALTRVDAAAAEAFLRHRVRPEETNAAVREMAEGHLRVIELGRQPLELSFTAVDGRAVDLQALRGKVVLVDFWATWCVPCVAELPNVKKVYDAYHDRGFEVVGISLENGRLMPTDTPEQHAAKMDKAAKMLTDFTARRGLPWPQYFDGKYWKNDISAKYAIGSIPAMFLLDQQGKVVSTEAHGESLEKEVRRLLKL